MPSFHFTVPGQPISLNHAYRPVRYKTPNGYQRRMAKAPGVEEYQLVAMSAAARAKPPDFDPKGMIRLVFDMHLRRDIDCDNVLKVVVDAVALGMNINDKRILPCVRSKETGHREPYLEIAVSEEEPDHHH